MKVKLILMILSLLSFAGTASGQKVSMQMDNAKVGKILEAISKQTGLSLAYSKQVVNPERVISIHLSDSTIEKALDRVIANTNLNYEIRNGKIYLFEKGNIASQVPIRKVKITGTIVNAGGESIIGVNIMEKGTSNGNVTDIDGRFTIQVSENATLQVSYIGYISQEIKLKPGETVLNIILKEDTQTLNEVIVIGYGTQKKVHLTGAVNTVSAKEIENRPVKNLTSALQGLAPNLNIIITSGELNNAPNINVRGFESINSNNNTLILVDNVPVDAGTLSRINPADIESVSLLKDAASAAVYGARAAFGVILLTTKTAKNEKLEVSADFNFGLRSLMTDGAIDLNLVNFFEGINASGSDPNWATAGQIEYARQRMADPSLPAVIFPDIKHGTGRWGYYAMTDWWDIMIKDVAPTYTANVSIRQRTDRLTYALSGGFYQENSLFQNENPYKRLNFRGTGNYQLTDWWKLGSMISLARSDYNTNIKNNNFGGIRQNYIHSPIYNPDGTHAREANRYWNAMEGERYIQKINETFLTFNTEVNIIKDILNLKGDITFRIYDEDGNEHELPIYRSTNPISELEKQNSSRAKVWTTDINYTVLNFYGNFNKTFADKHNIYAMIGYNQEYYKYKNHEASRRDLITNNLPTISLSTGEMAMSENIQSYAIRGAFGRIGYIFDDKYILETNGRYDGTSKFSKNNRFGFFPSITGGWIISQEKFFNPVKERLKVDFLKIRGSYGELGNQSVQGNYPYLATMGRGQIGYFLNNSRPIAIYAPGSSPANDLSWERVRSFNIGIDLNLLNNRLNISFDKYTRHTKGMLTQILELPAVYGVPSPASNAADLKNKGFELTVGYRDQIDLGGSPLSFNVKVLLSDSRAWITKYKNENGILSSWREGQEIGEIWGFETLGFFTKDDFEDPATGTLKKDVPTQDKVCDFILQPGDIRFKDLDNNGEISKGESTEHNPGDLKVIGNNRIRLPYSIEMAADWKGFDLRVFFQGIGKRDWYFDNNWFWSNFCETWQAPSIYLQDRWKPSANDPYIPENPNPYFPRLNGANRNYVINNPNTQYLQNISYLRLKNLTVGYTLPMLLTKKWRIDRLRFYVSGENLWTLNHIHVKEIDPESLGSAYPLQRIFSCGFNLSF